MYIKYHIDIRRMNKKFKNEFQFKKKGNNSYFHGYY